MRIKLAKSLTTVTTFSKFMALMLFILLPLVAFKMGMEYGTLMERCNDMMRKSYAPINGIPPTSDVKYYKNREYGISFQFPSEWRINQDAQHFKEGKDVMSISIWGASQKEGTELYDGASFSVGTPIKTAQKPREWMRNYFGDTSEVTGEKYVFDTIIIGNRTFETMYACGLGCHTYYITRNGDSMFRFIATTEGPNEQMYDKQIIKILESLEL